MTRKLVLLRHGQSAWNLENRFTGWVDVDLTGAGRAEAIQGAQDLRDEGIDFDVAFTSNLKRAIRTLWLVLEELDRMWIPVKRSWRLNERHYGALQGLNKAETAREHGEEQVHVWRRSYDVPPPPLDWDDERHPRFDVRYRDLDARVLPSTESLKLTLDRVLPYWFDAIAPQLLSGRNVLVTAHGNSLRALYKFLNGISDEEIPSLNIPTGIPLLFELDDNLRVQDYRYLGDAERARTAAEAVARQGEAQ